MINTLVKSNNVKKVLGVALALAMAFTFMFAVTQSANAQITTDEILGEDVGFGEATGLGTGDLRTTIAQIIRVVLGFLGVVAVVIVLMGGFKWMTAGGNDDKVSEAKKLLIAGVIGLAIILSAYAITQFVISNLVSATTL